MKQYNGNGKNTILVSHWNLGSKKWINKRNQIQVLVDQTAPDIIFISEANLEESTPVYESVISGYSITLPKTVTINGTARLVMLTKTGLDYTLKADLMCDTVSSIWIKISRPGAKSLLICGVYREHQFLNQDSDWSLQPVEQIRRWRSFLSQVESARIASTCHIIGDVNLDHSRWNSPDHLHLQMVSDSKNTLESGGFTQLVTDVTRSWPGQNDTLIDHFWSNDIQKILSVTNTVRAVGDHNVISARIRLRGKDVKKLDIRKRSYKNFDPVTYRAILETFNWADIYEIQDVDLANDFIESRIVETLDKLCPYKTVQFRKDCKTWLKDETKEKMRQRDETRELAKTTDDQVKWREYRKLRNEVNNLVDKDKKSYYDDIYERHSVSNDVGATYRAAKNQAGISKNSTPTSFLHDGRKITEPQAMADLQMKVFSEKVEKLINDLPPPSIDPCEILEKSLKDWGPRKDAREIFEFKTITELDTLKIIKELGNTTSSAHDRLDTLAIKHGAAVLHGPLTHVINTSIRTSKFANRWKIGKLLPLHKGKGLPMDDPKSFRPISLLPVIGKIIERVLQPQILEYMENSGQLNTNHHSYRKFHSTTTAMLQLSDAIFTGCNSNKITTLITLDQSAAFDVIRHSLLYKKLKLYNFGDQALGWITSFLSFRSQYVSIGTRQSAFSEVKSGVPQGSVLGPILYVLYVNELPAIMNEPDCQDPVHTRVDRLFTDNCENCGQLPTYADDSTVVITTKNRFDAQSRINDVTKKVGQFLSSNSLALNIGKTEIVEVMVRQKRALQLGTPPQLAVRNPDSTFKVISAKDSCRLLGGNINKDANWTHHLELGEKPLCHSLRSTVGMLGHLSKFLPRKSRLLLANGLFKSRLIYLLPMWGGLTVRDTNKIQRLINRCARIVLNKGRRTRTRALMEGCGWLYMTELVEYHTAIQTYKIIFLKKPTNLRNMFSIDQTNRIQQVEGRLQTARTSFRWRAAKTWNSLPDFVIDAEKLSIFKKRLKRHLTDARLPVAPRRQLNQD